MCIKHNDKLKLHINLFQT